MGFLRFLMLITTIPIWFYLFLSPFRLFFRIRTESGSIWAFVYLLLLPIFSWLLCIIQALIDLKDWLIHGDVKNWKYIEKLPDKAVVVEKLKESRPKSVRRIIIEEEEHY
tara:strand:- start:26 stop:355 length:330 start_codon:yes stop_codon:yes gene_type:complete